MGANKTKPLFSQKVIASLIIILGVLLLFFMVLVEDEPGAIPLFLILAGSGWYLWLHRRVRKSLNK